MDPSWLWVDADPQAPHQQQLAASSGQVSRKEFKDFVRRVEVESSESRKHREQQSKQINTMLTQQQQTIKTQEIMIQEFAEQRKHQQTDLEERAKAQKARDKRDDALMVTLGNLTAVMQPKTQGNHSSTPSAGDVRRMLLRRVKNELDKSELWSYHAVAPRSKRDREAAEAAGFDLSYLPADATGQTRKKGKRSCTEPMTA
ncbi:hypothetical protein WJX74_004493 [Apatococcus lobatus]|uniref:Uncharacterized protein n=1 Tax=Apatococcus lobatus TaxID=904363 RepID=A0AAW1RP98_9CHLO